MKRFSLFSIGYISLITLLTGCATKEKAEPSGPVRGDVQVVGTSGSGTAGKEYSGTVEASEASTISFSVPGTITKMYVTEGQKVSKGQLLAQVKSESLINSRNIAQAELEEARDAYQRLKKLHDADALPDIKWVEIQAKLKQAENVAELADRAVTDASVHAPFSGYISQKFADEGQTVVPAEPILKLMSLDNLQIEISVPENEISSFGPQSSATVSFDIDGKLVINGKMAHKSVSANPLTRAYSVKFNIAETGGKILPGMIGTVTVDKDAVAIDSVAVGKIEVVLPSQAVLLNSDNQQFVWIVKGGKAYRRNVVADELADDGVTVRDGITPGDSVIVAGMQKVSTGTPVTVI